MNARSVFCLVGVLVLAGITARADTDLIIGSPPAPIPQPKNDALSRYKHIVYQAVGSHWFPAIDRLSGSIPPGKVHLSFTIHSDGNISDITILGGKDQTALANLSINALHDSAPYAPFDADLRKQVGDKYTDDFTFTNAAKK